MAVSIPGYQQDLPDEMVLGYIAWYTITHPKVAHEELVEWIDELGLSPSIVSKTGPRTGDAFKRACRYSERKGVPIPGSENTVNIMFRSVATTTTEVERHMVAEVVDPNGRRLHYHTAATMVLNRKTNVLNTTTNRVAGPLQEILDESLTAFKANLEDALKYVDPQALRRLIRQQLRLMLAISVRPKGSVYYFPGAYREQGEALEELCERIGSGSGFHMLPLVNTRKQRDMIKVAFTKDIHEEAQQVFQDLRKLSSKKEVQASVVAALKSRVDTVERMVDSYESLIDEQLTQAKAEAVMMRKELMSILMSGAVK